MKKLLPIFFVIFLTENLPAYSQTGKNCFTTKFNKDATGLEPTNAYLLSYLCTMSYPGYLRYLFTGPGYGLDGDSVEVLQNDNKFVIAYANKLGYLFIDKDAPPKLIVNASDVKLVNPDLNRSANIIKNITGTAVKDPAVATFSAPNGQSVTFDFQNKCNPNGYDPEAIIISTPTTIFVVFRGTDRVACNTNPALGKFGYEWGEWVASDFQFLKKDANTLGPGVTGNVHRGMTESLLSQGFADSLASRIINKYQGAGKKIWITGHSLGGAHAQLFAMFLKHNYQLQPQGLYLYEAPHPGDKTFVDQLNAEIGKNKIQRFEFSDDPIPTLPPQAFLFGRAGVRNYFKDVNSAMQSGKEQIPLLDDAKIFCGIGNLPSDEIPAFTKLNIISGCGGTFCYHHPTWVLQACRHQLASSLFSSLPPEVPLPVGGDNCNTFAVAQGKQNDVINNVATVFETSIRNAVSDIAWTAGLLTDNILDNAIAQGNYELVSYKFRNDVRNALEWPWTNKNAGTPESKLRVANILNPGNNIFHIEHDALGLGYRISMPSGNNTKFYMEIPLFGSGDNGTLIQMQENHPFDGQIWLFYKMPNTSNVYVIYNKLSHKVIDAYNNCPNDAGDCKLQQMSPGNGDQTQLWVLRKID